VAIAMNIVDRFASAVQTTSPRSQENRLAQDRAEYQLVIITALYISIKLNERTIFGSQDFAAASRGMYSLQDIQGMELKILHALSWRMYPPTSLQVANQILSLMLSQYAHTNIKQETLDLLQEEVAFQTENAVRDYYFATQRPSTIAVAAITNAIQRVSKTISDCRYLMEALIRILKEFSFDSSAVLLKVRHRLLRLMSERETDKNTSRMGSERTRPNDYISPSFVQLAQDNAEQAMPPPRLVIYEDTSGDDSCATMCYD
jgi:hypothetical protein